MGTKISDLTDGTTADATDRVPVARSPFGTTTTRYITPAYIGTYLDGTNRTVSGDWTFSSAFLAQGTGNLFDAAGALGHGGGDGLLHLFTASAGTVSANADADELVVENSANAGISILTPATSNATIAFGDPDDNNVGKITYDHTNNAMVFTVNATDTITVDSNLDVGIGTSSPDGQLHLFVSDCTATAVAGGDDLIIENDTNAGLSIITHNDQSSSIYFGDEDDADVGSHVYDHGNGHIFTSETVSNVTMNDQGLAVDATQGLVGSATGVLLQARTADSSATVNANANEIVAENSGTCGISILSGATSNGVLAFGSSTDDDEGYILYNHNTARLVFKTNGAECALWNSNKFMHLDPAGTFSLAGNDYHSHRNANNLSGAINTVLINGGASTDNTSSFLLSCSTGAADRLYIYGNGNVVNSNNSYGALSDKKLKTDIQYQDHTQWDDIKSLKLAKYKMKDDGSKRTQLGLIAQDVEKVSPGLVNTSARPGHGDIVKTINYSVLNLKMLGALKEAMERIEELEKKVK